MISLDSDTQMNKKCHKSEIFLEHRILKVNYLVFYPTVAVLHLLTKKLVQDLMELQEAQIFEVT